MTVDLRVEVFDDVEAMAREAASFVAARARIAAAEHGSFTFAVSGGATPRPMFEALRADDDVPWTSTAIFQVDERVAPPGHAERNLTHLEAHLLDGLGDRPSVHPMPVDDADLERAAAGYAAELPAAFDLIHLGIGADGHTASLVPGDPVLEVADREVAVTDVYEGWRRMTLTYPVLDGARDVLWLIAGEEKAESFARLRERDPSIPAGRVRAGRQIVFADRAATR